jgi:hypothetical protein
VTLAVLRGTVGLVVRVDWMGGERCGVSVRSSEQRL